MKLSLLMLVLNAVLLAAWVCVALLFTMKTSIIKMENGSLIISKDSAATTTTAERMVRNPTFMERTDTSLSSTDGENEVEIISSENISKDEDGNEDAVQVETNDSSSITTPEEKSPIIESKEEIPLMPANDKKAGGIAQTEWKKNICGSIKDAVCHEVFVVKPRQATFCSAAKVASTTTKQYFYDIAGDMVIPEGARFGVHEANWTKFGKIPQEAREWVLENKDWTHVFFWKHVLERFISGYLDKVVKDCTKDPEAKPHLAIHHYIQYGFSCKEHEDLEKFVTFMETVPKVEGHFAPQTPLCNVERFPYTDIIQADENLSEKLKVISTKLGVPHPDENKKTTKHKTGAKEKMVEIFKDRPHLIKKILAMFKEDCERIPQSCDVKDIMAAIEGKE